jgi:hypothetical protein
MHKATKVLDALLDGREVTFDGYWPLVLDKNNDLCHRVTFGTPTWSEQVNKVMLHALADQDAPYDMTIGGGIAWFIGFCGQFTDDEIEEAVNAQSN